MRPFIQTELSPRLWETAGRIKSGEREFIWQLVCWLALNHHDQRGWFPLIRLLLGGDGERIKHRQEEDGEKVFKCTEFIVIIKKHWFYSLFSITKSTKNHFFLFFHWSFVPGFNLSHLFYVLSHSFIFSTNFCSLSRQKLLFLIQNESFTTQQQTQKPPQRSERIIKYRLFLSLCVIKERPTWLLT